MMRWAYWGSTLLTMANFFVACGTPASGVEDARIDRQDVRVHDAQANDSTHDVAQCVPNCNARSCGPDPRCNQTCGACASPQICTGAGVCEASSANGPSFIDPPRILGPQPTAAGTQLTIQCAVTDPQGLETIVTSEIQNPSVGGELGRYTTFTHLGGGVFRATVSWSSFSTANGGLPEDASGTTTRVLQIRFVDRDGNALVRDLVVRLGGCANALCQGVCAACPEHETARACLSSRCVATMCATGYHLCGESCADNNDVDTCGASCTPCAAPTNETATCTEGVCGHQCNDGFVRNVSGACVLPTWTQVASTGPSARRYPAMAYDSIRNRTVLFGGQSDSNGQSRSLSDTWEWDGSTWMQVASTGPSARNGHVLVFDSTRNRVVLFGGDNNGLLGDTWEWDGSRWTQVATDGPTRAAHGMAYDSMRNRVVLFGGYNDGPLGDTWEWNGTVWREIVGTNPPLRTGHEMSFDAARARMVIFGGSGSATLDYLADTWERSGDAWTHAETVNGPEARTAQAMAYDSTRRRTVLFGGFGRQHLRDTWDWDGVTWRQIGTAGPSARVGSVMAYDSTRNRMVLFGGSADTASGSNLADTWELGAD